jgi:site-specific DNA-methyltransferase (adenine-specific)
LYARLDAEFHFTLDPCPLDRSATAGAPLWGKDGLARSWAGERVFCNPPYSDILPWLAKAREAEVAVYLVPSRTDTRWWHEHALAAQEIRFIRGRLRFGGERDNAPFPSAVVIFKRMADAPGNAAGVP